MADYAGLDYDQLAQAYMRLLEERGSGFRGIPHEGAAYQSKDPGNHRYAVGEASRDVGLFDPVDALAGMLASKGATLARRGIQSFRRPVRPQPVDIPFDRYPLPSSSIPKGPEIDLSPHPLPAPDQMERWLADQLRTPTPEAREAIDWYLRGQRAGGYGGFAPKSPKSPTPLSEIPLEELLPRRPGQGDDQLLLAEFLEDYSRVLRGEPSTTLSRAPGAEPPDRLEALEMLRSHIDSILANMDIPGGGMHRPPGSGGQ